MIRTLLWISIAFSFGSAVDACCASFPDSTDFQQSVSSDTSQTTPYKISSRSNWERAVSLPGTIILIPFKILFEGVEWGAGAVENSKLVPRTMDFLTADDGSWAVFPTYASRSGGGVKFYARHLLRSNSKLTGIFTAGVRRRQHYELNLQRLRFSGGAIETGVTARYRMMSDESFFGIGPESLHEDESNFAHEQTAVEANVSVYLGSRSGINFNTGFSYNNIHRGRDPSYPSTTDIYTNNELPGLETRVQFVHLGFSFQHDSRNRLKNPTSGFEVIFSSAVYEDLNRDRYGYYRLTTDITRYFHLFTNRVLVLRVGAQVSEPFKNREIPFYFLSEFGSWQTVRGYTRGRFRDNDMLIGSIEYRYPVWRSIDAMIFVDGGKVSPNLFEDLSDGTFQWSYGGGFGLWNRRGRVVRAEIGVSRERVRFYFGLN